MRPRGALAARGRARAGGHRLSPPRYRRREDVLWRRSLDTVLLLPPMASEPVILAGTGPAVWEVLAAAVSAAELAAELAGCFGADTVEVEQDLEPVIERLVALGVVDVV